MSAYLTYLVPVGLILIGAGILWFLSHGGPSMKKKALLLAALLLTPVPAHAVTMRHDLLILSYCGLGPSIYACLDIGVPFLLDVQVSMEPAPVHLIERPQAIALGLPIGVPMDFYGLITGATYSTDWLYWGPFGLGIGVGLEAIAPTPPVAWGPGGDDDPLPVSTTPEPATLLLLGSVLAGVGWRRWRRP